MLDLALALRWSAIAAAHGTALALPWRPALLAELLPFAATTAADGTCLELGGELEGKPWRAAMLLPLRDGRASLAEAPNTVPSGYADLEARRSS